MGRSPCCDRQLLLKKGPWTPEEDKILGDYIQANGHDSWRSPPELAGNSNGRKKKHKSPQNGDFRSQRESLHKKPNLELTFDIAGALNAPASWCCQGPEPQSGPGPTGPRPVGHAPLMTPFLPCL